MPCIPVDHFISQIDIFDIYVARNRIIRSSLRIDILTVKNPTKTCMPKPSDVHFVLHDNTGALICLFLIYHCFVGTVGQFWHMKFCHLIRCADEMRNDFWSHDMFKYCIVLFIGAMLYLDTTCFDPNLDQVPFIKKNNKKKL